MKKNKDFDCVEMKNAIQARIYDEIKDMSPQEEIAHRRKKIEAGPMADLYRQLLEKANGAKKSAG